MKKGKPDQLAPEALLARREKPDRRGQQANAARRDCPALKAPKETSALLALRVTKEFRG